MIAEAVVHVDDLLQQEVIKIYTLRSQRKRQVDRAVIAEATVHLSPAAPAAMQAAVLTQPLPRQLPCSYTFTVPLPITSMSHVTTTSPTCPLPMPLPDAPQALPGAALPAPHSSFPAAPEPYPASSISLASCPCPCRFPTAHPPHLVHRRHCKQRRFQAPTRASLQLQDPS